MKATFLLDCITTITPELCITAHDFEGNMYKFQLDKLTYISPFATVEGDVTEELTTEKGKKHYKLEHVTIK